MKKSGQSKMKVQLYEGLLVVVIIVVIVVLILAVRSDKKNIEKTFDNTLTDLKSTCLSYDDWLHNSRNEAPKPSSAKAH